MRNSILCSDATGVNGTPAEPVDPTGLGVPAATGPAVILDGVRYPLAVEDPDTRDRAERAVRESREVRFDLAGLIDLDPLTAGGLVDDLAAGLAARPGWVGRAFDAVLALDPGPHRPGPDGVDRRHLAWARCAARAAAAACGDLAEVGAYADRIAARAGEAGVHYCSNARRQIEDAVRVRLAKQHPTGDAAGGPTGEPVVDEQAITEANVRLRAYLAAAPLSAPRGRVGTSAAARQPAARFAFVPTPALMAGDYRPEWLVERVLVRGQPGVVAGPSKGLKTNLSVDLAVSLAAGVPFLGKFQVPAPRRVAVVSGESGQATLQETARRVCKAKGVDPDVLGDGLSWCFALPTFSDPAAMAAFAGALAGLKPDVVVIDPVYLALGAVDARNLFEAGAAFRAVAETLLGVGCTPVLVHHANRQLTAGQPMELSHLAYTGLEQFARQFLLVNRREPYAGDGIHDLWLTIGGSAGHGGLWNLHVEEGVTDETSGGRRWEVTLRTLDQARDAAASAREAGKAAQFAEDCRRVVGVIARLNTGGPRATATAVRTHARLSKARADAALAELVDRGGVDVSPHPVAVGNGAVRTLDVYTLGGPRPDGTGG